MKPSELARKAIDVLRSSGWTQGDFCIREVVPAAIPSDPERMLSSFSYCLLGAIFRADGQDSERLMSHDVTECSIAARTVVDEVGRVIGGTKTKAERFSDVHTWNDRPERTKAEVLRVLTIAAVNLAVSDA